MRLASWLESDRLAKAAVSALRLEGYKGCTLVEMNPGNGVFAHRLQVIQPRQHILLEPNVSFQVPLRKLQKSHPGVEVRVQDGFQWSTYLDLEKEGKLQGLKVDAKEENKHLLFVGNIMRGHQGEQLLNQFLGCIGEQIWLQHYGRVRMLLWMNSALARRMLSRPGDRPARTRASVIAEALADMRLVVAPQGEGAEVMSMAGDVAPEEQAALLDIRPRPWTGRKCDFEVFDYVLKNLFTCRSMGVRQALDVAAPKGSSLLLRLPHIHPATKVCDLMVEELLDISRAFDAWPFRPQYLWDERIDNLERQNLKF